MNKNDIENELKIKIVRDIGDEEKVAIYHAEFELVEEEHERMSSLAERVMYSLYSEVDEIVLTAALLDNEEIKLYEKELNPIFDNDINRDILKILKKKFYRNYRTIFLNMPYNELENLEINDIKGELTDEKGEKYDIRFKLRKENKYIKKLKELYENFHKNKMKWQNVYLPFAYRAYSLVISEISKKLESRLSFIEKGSVKIHYPEKIKESVIEKVLCWNIKETMETPIILVRPTEEQLYYEHIIQKPKGNVLVSKEVSEFEFLYNDTSTLRIITKNSKYEKIRLYLVNQVSEDLKNKMSIYGNHRKLDRISNNKRENVLILRNIEEINELLSQYEMFKNYHISGFSSETEEIIPIYDLMIEGKNEFSIKNKKKNLYLTLRYEETEYSTDIVSFMKAILEEYLIDCNCIFTK